MKDTKKSILDVAERLFAQAGYARTSVRAIVECAEVNIAAINYHFKSKEGLFIEVIRRRVKEIEKARFTMLDAYLKKTNNQPTIEGVVRSFLVPVCRGLEINDQVPKILVRIFSESSDLKQKIIKPIFSKTRDRFFSAFKLALPELSDEEIQWRFQYLIASMVGLFIFSEEVNFALAQFSKKQDLVERLIQQTLNGIEGHTIKGDKSYA